jgi:purine-binding chemotaxis protein CheW
MTEVKVRVLAGGEHYALPVTFVKEIAELGELSPVPGAPSQVLGLRNLRGQVLPVIGLAEVLGLDGAESERVVVVEDDGRQLALALQAVIEVEKLSGEVEEVDSPYLEGAVLVDGALVGLVDVPAVFESLVPDAATPSAPLEAA